MKHFSLLITTSNYYSHICTHASSVVCRSNLRCLYYFLSCGRYLQNAVSRLTKQKKSKRKVNEKRKHIFLFRHSFPVNDWPWVSLLLLIHLVLSQLFSAMKRCCHSPGVGPSVWNPLETFQPLLPDYCTDDTENYSKTVKIITEMCVVTTSFLEKLKYTI